MKHAFASALMGLGLYVACSTAFAPPASAHHGWSGYTADLDMVAEITEVKLGNPHDRLTVKDADGGEWDLLLAPPVRNRRYGFDGSSVHVGDMVRLIGERHPSRLEAKIHQIWRDDEMIYEYLYDGRRTSYERLGKTPPQVTPDQDS